MKYFGLLILILLLGQCNPRQRKTETTVREDSTYSISGRVKFCYTEKDNKNKFTFRVGLIDESDVKTWIETSTDSSCIFKFTGLKLGQYTLRTTFPVNTDTVLVLDRNIDGIVLCTDDLFKPVPPDSLSISINTAKSDLKNGRFKIYRMGHYQTHLTEQEGNLNSIIEQVRKKYKCEIMEVEGDYLSREGVIKLEKCLAYNRTIREYLRTK
jgi:hypothetical protein